MGKQLQNKSCRTTYSVSAYLMFTLHNQQIILLYRREVKRCDGSQSKREGEICFGRFFWSFLTRCPGNGNRLSVFRSFVINWDVAKWNVYNGVVSTTEMVITTRNENRNVQRTEFLTGSSQDTSRCVATVYSIAILKKGGLNRFQLNETFPIINSVYI